MIQLNYFESTNKTYSADFYVKEEFKDEVLKVLKSLPYSPRFKNLRLNGFDIITFGLPQYVSVRIKFKEHISQEIIFEFCDKLSMELDVDLDFEIL